MFRGERDGPRLIRRTIASDAIHLVAGNVSEGVGSAWPVRSLDSSTVGDTSPGETFPASSSWFAEADLGRLAIGSRAEALRYRNCKVWRVTVRLKPDTTYECSA